MGIVCCDEKTQAGTAPGQQVNYDASSVASSINRSQQAREAKIYVQQIRHELGPYDFIGPRPEEEERVVRTKKSKVALGNGDFYSGEWDD